MRRSWLAAIILFMICSVWAENSVAVSAPTAKNVTYKDLQLLSEILDEIQENYYKPMDMSKCVEKILQKGISNCTDVYSFYLTPKQRKFEWQKMSGHFYGIGVRLSQKKYKDVNYVAVMSVIKNSPAEKAELKSGDLILAVSSDGIKSHAVNAEGININELVDLIQGDKDTHVYIKIFRDPEILEFDLIRDDIKIETVSFKLLKPKIGYLRISEFFGDLNSDFRNAMADLKKQGIEVLILDLRYNTGGQLSLALDISELFRKDSFGYIVYTVGRDGVKIPEDPGRFGIRLTGGRYRDLKLIVLTNERSASASEIATAYLKNYCDAKVVGKNTFGKGIVQRLIPLSNGGELHLTISEYLVGPNFVKVDGVGVSPDYEVDESTSAVKEEDSLQLKKAIEVAEEMLKQK